MQCVILIGGLGTRLGSLVQDCPKPMLSVAGRPFLEFLLENMARFGFTDFVFLAGYKADVVRAHFSDTEGIARKLGINIDIIIEQEPLGTGGALSNASAYLAPEFLLINGDSYFDFNLLDLACIPDSDPWLARMALRQVDDVSRYGVVSLEKDGHVSTMMERPDPNACGSGLINGGIYWLRRDILDRFPKGKCSIERDIFPGLAKEGLLFGREYHGFFLDIGIHEDFEAAQTLLPLRRPAVFFDRDGVLNQDSGYTYLKEKFHWIDGAVEAIRKANDANWFVFVVTNQAGVARGFYEERDVQNLHQWINSTLQKKGAHIDDFRYCPHHPDGIIAKYKKQCAWRKPNPGMIMDLIVNWPVEVENSILIGDKKSDIEAADRGGLKSHLFDKTWGQWYDYTLEVI